MRSLVPLYLPGSEMTDFLLKAHPFVEWSWVDGVTLAYSGAAEPRDWVLLFPFCC